MTDFTQQLTNYDGDPSSQGEKTKDLNTGKEKIVQQPLTIRRCAYFALLDVAPFQDGAENKLFTAETHQRRYHLMKKIDKDPKNVDMSPDEKDLLITLLPLRFDVVVVGQIMDLL